MVVPARAPGPTGHRGAHWLLLLVPATRAAPQAALLWTEAAPSDRWCEARRLGFRLRGDVFDSGPRGLRRLQGRAKPASRGLYPPRWSGCVPLRPGTFLPARPGAVSVRPSVWSAGAMLWVTWSWQGAGQTRSRGQAVKVDCALPGKTRSRHPPKGWRTHHQPAGLRLQKAEGCVHALQETEPRGRGRGVHSPPDAGAEASALLHDRPAAPED